jgi:hypothetical protein
MPPHLGSMIGHPQVNGHMPIQKSNGPQLLAQLNEQTWVQMGQFSTRKSNHLAVS